MKRAQDLMLSVGVREQCYSSLILMRANDRSVVFELPFEEGFLGFHLEELGEDLFGVGLTNMN